MINRRRLLVAGCGAIAATALPMRLLIAGQQVTANALQDTDLIYLTPIRSDGSESRCQSEVWFVADGVDIFIVTGSDTWRARAIGKGLLDARIWVGDVGQWNSSEGKYRSLPQLEAKGSPVVDVDEQARVLELYGSKYRLHWILWESRFRKGLADGSRQMFRYHPVQG